MEIETVGKVTASFVVTEINKKAFLEGIVAKADEALYRAKSTGRNKVEY